MTVRFAIGLPDDRTERAWRELWERVGAPPWMHPTWSRLWWDAFGSGRPALACVAREGRLVAIAPTAIVGREIRALANGHSPAWAILAEDDEALAVAAGAVFGRRLRVNLVPLRAEEPSATALRRAASSAGYRALERRVGVAPTIDLEPRAADEPGSARLRREIRRRWRRLGEAGDVSFELRTDPGGVEAALERCLAVEARGWKGETGTAIAARPETIRFYRELARWAAGEGWFATAELRLNGATIAFDLVLEARGVHHLLKTSFDPAFARFAPGTLLRATMIGRASALGLRRYELLGKFDAWKREWTSEGHEMLQLRAFPSTVAGIAGRAAFGAAWALRDRRARAEPSID